jgi:hypothetical protein
MIPGALDIVGNGPSRKYWEQGKFEFGKSGVFSIGCNAAEDTDLICVVDRHVLDKVIGGRFRPKKPVILGYNASEYIFQAQGARRHLHIVGDVRKDGKHGANAGQCALIWGLRLGFREFHLWGFDSLWTRDRTSVTHATWGNVERGKVIEAEGCLPVREAWDEGWTRIREQAHPDTKYYLHADEGATVPKMFTVINES